MTNWKKILFPCLNGREKKERDVNKLGSKVISKIKNFDHKNLTSEQELLIGKLITNKELKERYKKYGLCQECNQPCAGITQDIPWCRSCNAKRFEQDFDKWTSGNRAIDEFIQGSQVEARTRLEILEWIPYEKFTNIEHLAEGGFGEVYKAWWDEGYTTNWNIKENKWGKGLDDRKVVLKRLKNSQNIEKKFLHEILFHKRVDSSTSIVRCYGISQDPKTKDYLMVFDYMDEGNLRNFLNNNCDKLTFKDKLSHLYDIARGLNDIHKQNLVHCDFHSGNILNKYYDNNPYSLITDLGLCRPVDETSERNIYGVIPFMAPEILRGEVYTQASDIYSFGMVAYELFSGLPPHYEIPHDIQLSVKICEGFRPSLNSLKIPQLLKDLIAQCWNADPLLRPITSSLCEDLGNWSSEIGNDKFGLGGKVNENSKFYLQYKEIEGEYNQVFRNYKTHPQAFYTSRPLTNLSLLPLSETQDLQEENLVINQRSEIQVSPKKMY